MLKKWSELKKRMVPYVLCENCEQGIVKCNINDMLLLLKDELQNNNLFYARDLLDRWIKYGGLICPVCKGYYKIEIPEDGVGVK